MYIEYITIFIQTITFSHLKECRLLKVTTSLKECRLLKIITSKTMDLTITL